MESATTTVCFLTANTFPTPGGVEIRISRYVRRLPNFGIETAVVAGTATYQRIRSEKEMSGLEDAPVGSLLPPEETGGTTIYRIVLPLKNNYRRYAIFRKNFFQLYDSGAIDADVYSVLSTQVIFLIPLLHKLKRKKKKLVFNYSIAHSSGNSPLKRLVKHLLLQMALRYFDKIIVASQELKDYLQKSGVEQSIEVITNGVDTSHFAPVQTVQEKASLRTKLGLSETGTILLGAGPVYPRKGPLLLLQAWELLKDTYPNLWVVWIGRRRDKFDPQLTDYNRDIERISSSPEGQKRIILAGHIENPETVRCFYQASDVFVFPSEREGLPNAVLEAMASGLPVIMSEFIGHTTEMGKAGDEYLMVERNPEHIAQAIDKVITDKTMARNLGQNARTHIYEHMDIDSSVKLHAQVYHGLHDRALTNS